MKVVLTVAKRPEMEKAKETQDSQENSRLYTYDSKQGQHDVIAVSSWWERQLGHSLTLPAGGPRQKAHEPREWPRALQGQPRTFVC